MTLFTESNPTKSQYKTYLRQSSAAWCSEGEAISDVSKSVVKAVRTRTKFCKHEGIAAAISYGLSHKLITLNELEDGYFQVMPTQNGFKEIEAMKKTTCAFTGRKI